VCEVCVCFAIFSFSCVRKSAEFFMDFLSGFLMLRLSFLVESLLICSQHSLRFLFTLVGLQEEKYNTAPNTPRYT